MATGIGLMIEGQWGLTWARWDALLKAAEDYGLQSVFRSDHYTIGPPDDNSLECFISLTYAALHTKRIEFGQLVSPTTFRQPVLTARMAAQIDDLSGGRLCLGLGTGWHDREHHQYGIPFFDQNIRYEMFEDALEITTRLYRQEEPVTYQGKHFSLNGAVLLPRPARKNGPPIIIGGNGPNRTLPLAAKYADEWNAVHLTLGDFKARNERLNELLDAIGRPRTEVRRSLMIPVTIAPNEAELKKKLGDQFQAADALVEWKRIIGLPEQVLEQVGRYAEAGMDRIMLMWQDQTDIEGIHLLAETLVGKV
ncbi:MAG: TIGR03560 family F420-dependent LLM class oxidoreductase [Pleurocapsa minor GSE-CHR-MK-17-07R]|jgi:F420-dependent oxidoreductase-like protein|nr:TIGR03560 family F420-dependent LLM class oxidoreductase [Pleurocapsa minor GSE-CHR-MK 17-07R]